jgi:hypothetical protein
MLELRPICENCARSLPPASLEARICSYECTFCADCVEHVLGDVCPNCGGGFTRRPIRPARDWHDGNFLGKDPPGSRRTHRPVDRTAHRRFSHRLKDIPPHSR